MSRPDIADEAALRRQPKPLDVARLWRSHGAQAVYERWSWLSSRNLYDIKQRGERLLAAGKH